MTQAETTATDIEETLRRLLSRGAATGTIEHEMRRASAYIEHGAIGDEQRQRLKLLFDEGLSLLAKGR